MSNSGHALMCGPPVRPASSAVASPAGEEAGNPADPGPDRIALHDDLAQLERLLKEAIAKLSTGFVGAHDALATLSRLPSPDPGIGPAQRALARTACDHLDSALTALQFEDIASQLIASARRHLGGDGMARSAGSVNRSVPQQHMESGGIDWF